jgi:hypothetical protein
LLESSSSYFSFSSSCFTHHQCHSVQALCHFLRRPQPLTSPLPLFYFQSLTQLLYRFCYPSSSIIIAAAIIFPPLFLHTDYSLKKPKKKNFFYSAENWFLSHGKIICAN